jgi:hypothetical protein
MLGGLTVLILCFSLAPQAVAHEPEGVGPCDDHEESRWSEWDQRYYGTWSRNCHPKVWTEDVPGGGMWVCVGAFSEGGNIEADGTRGDPTYHNHSEDCHLIPGLM